MTLNREFKFVFNPKDRSEFGGRRYFAVGANSLHKYIGESNAATAIRKAMESTQDRIIVRFRTRGAIYIYAQ